MSAIETKQVWSSISNDGLDSKYEKCRHITEEIYKRIDITFQIKKLETGTHSDDSDQRYEMYISLLYFYPYITYSTVCFQYHFVSFNLPFSF